MFAACVSTFSTVSFKSGDVAHYIEACNWRRYQWREDRWADYLAALAPIEDAIEVEVDVTPSPTERVQTKFVLSTQDGTSVVEEDPYPGPRPCVGTPPP